MKNIWIIGCGDIGIRVFKRIKQLYQNDELITSALIRSQRSVKRCNELGINTLLYDLDTPKILDKEEFKDAEVFYFAPPPKNGVTDNRLYNFLHQLKEAPSKIVLISTTGVYGDCGGQWIDELRLLDPQTSRAKRRVAAETILKEWATQYQKPYVILRVPGIYAKNRLPLDRLKKKLPVVQSSEAAFTNRIQADDLAEICITAMNSKFAAEIFNATDGNPGTMVDYFNEIADYSGLERPPQISLKEAQITLSAGMLSYASESRRIGNAKLLNLLDIKLQYPTLKSTLK